ncbi:ATP-binding cassette domain-containing protein [Sneathiella chungangensis]|uniref:ATP-binding cassette domain-containing protein n=1 Tax=Sneathiella chungangensis TaxID=1418234 RepID=A0A845MGP6_9PROT|nr:ABC transporter ATP-binding protein [Sneathiella chungangensis]MZR22427.1 ATP-binding cassette domain-containing protein [Sneathiella chungangensis]
MSFLELKSLTKNFGGLCAVDGFSLDIAKGSVNALVGPNGCGKSTLFNLITGTIRPDSGEVLFAGVNITGRPPHEIARLGIGRKFQVPAIFDELTVRENLIVASRKQNDRTAQADILAQIHLEDQADTLAGELAHGQKQWLEIGLLLAQAPALILLDEPTAGMTAPETRATAELIHRINRDRGLTVLVIEHDMGFIEHLACPVHVMSKGKILKSGNFSEIRNDADVKALYFGTAEETVDA